MRTRNAKRCPSCCGNDCEIGYCCCGEGDDRECVESTPEMCEKVEGVFSGSLEDCETLCNRTTYVCRTDSVGYSRCVAESVPPNSTGDVTTEDQCLESCQDTFGCSQVVGDDGLPDFQCQPSRTSPGDTSTSEGECAQDCGRIMCRCQEEIINDARKSDSFSGPITRSVWERLTTSGDGTLGYVRDAPAPGVATGTLTVEGVIDAQQSLTVRIRDGAVFAVSAVISSSLQFGNHTGSVVVDVNQFEGSSEIETDRINRVASQVSFSMSLSISNSMTAIDPIDDHNQIAIDNNGDLFRSVDRANSEFTRPPCEYTQNYTATATLTTSSGMSLSVTHGLERENSAGILDLTVDILTPNGTFAHPTESNISWSLSAEGRGEVTEPRCVRIDPLPPPPPDPQAAQSQSLPGATLTSLISEIRGTSTDE